VGQAVRHAGTAFVQCLFALDDALGFLVLDLRLVDRGVEFVEFPLRLVDGFLRDANPDLRRG
jgi:hypothetical protein